MSTVTELKPAAEAPAGGSRASSMVAGGILLSRISGLVRERVFAQFFGTSLYADVFRAGLRMPNMLQNLLGEGTLSASFIPVYAELLEQGREEEAGKVAGAIFALLLAVAGALALVGVLLAEPLVSFLLPGFTGERRALTVAVSRILFPMTGILVLSAWSLGILNSHRRFFIPYFAPVLWNGAMITTLLVFGGRFDLARLVVALAWGALIGGALQFLIQLPWVLSLERNLRLSWGKGLAPVREAVKNAGPAILGRGVVQLSGWLDMVLASLLAVGAVAAIGYAQTIYVLPVSLFGMSIAAAELPELSRRRAGGMDILRERTQAALRRVAFFVVPTFVAFVLLGDVWVAALYQTGEFGADDTRLVYLTLAGYALGLIASTSTRLFSSAFFALRDTRTPARIAAVRVVTSALVAFVLMTQFEPVRVFGYTFGPGFGADLRIGTRTLGAVGLALGTGAGAWLEWALLRRELNKRIGAVGAGAAIMTRMLVASIAGAAAGWGTRLLIGSVHPVLDAALIGGAFGVVYVGLGVVLGIEQASVFANRIRRLAGRRS